MVTTMQKRGMMMGPMKGHMAPNSSPFKPTINKLSSQYLIQDHMSSHYIKLGTTKAAIDNKPPKSMATSVKKKDQMRREAMAKQMKLFDFEKGMKHSSASPHRQSPYSDFGSQRMLSVTVTKNGYDEARPYSVGSMRSSVRPRSASSPRSTTSLNSPRNKNSPRNSQKPDILNQTYSGDYLDRHEDKFKNTDIPFTPRLKNRPGKSYLSQSKHYAPPLVVQKETKRKTSTIKRDDDAEKASPASSSSDLRAYEKTPDGTREQERRWMEDQSELVQRLTLDDSKQTYDNIYSSKPSTVDQYGFRRNATGDTFFGTSSLGRSFIRSEAFSNETRNRIEAEEDEKKYLEFINGVTNDILTRGIYSDRVLTQVMQRHLDQNRGRLSEGRMRHMLIKLQEDLGVSSDIATTSFSTSRDYTYDDEYRPLRSTKSRGYESDQSERSTAGRKVSSGSQKPSSLKLGPRTHSTLSDREGILKRPGTSSSSERDLKSVTVMLVEGDKIKFEENVSGKNEKSQILNETAEKKSDVSDHIFKPPVPAKRTSMQSSVAPSLEDDDLVLNDDEKPTGSAIAKPGDIQKSEGESADGSDLDDF